MGPALDNRLLAYRENARRVPSVTGEVVPERVHTRSGYRREILERIYEDLTELDREGTLRDEWVNARGAIARFQRGSIEIRVIDTQECVRADVAVVAAVVGAVRSVADGPLLDPDAASNVEQETLTEVLEQAIYLGDRAHVASPEYLEVLGAPAGRRGSPSLREVWQHLAEVGAYRDPAASELSDALEVILEDGPLARRIREAVQGADTYAEPTRNQLRSVYERLADCVSAGEMFRAGMG
jgi:hypothetical protein